MGGVELLRGTTSSYNSDGLPEDYTAAGYPTINYTWGVNKQLKDQDFIDWNKSFEYFGNGISKLLEEQVDIDGQSIRYDYDQLGRLKDVCHPEEQVLPFARL